MAMNLRHILFTRKHFPFCRADRRLCFRGSWRRKREECAVTRGEKDNSCDVAEYRVISTLRITVAEHVVHSNVQQVLLSNSCVASARPYVLKTALEERIFGGSSCSNIPTGLLLSNTMFTDKTGLICDWPWTFTISIQTTQIIRHDTNNDFQ